MDIVKMQPAIFAGSFGEVIGKSSVETAKMDPAELKAQYPAWDYNNQIIEA